MHFTKHNIDNGFRIEFSKFFRWTLCWLCVVWKHHTTIIVIAIAPLKFTKKKRQKKTFRATASKRTPSVKLKIQQRRKTICFLHTYLQLQLQFTLSNFFIRLSFTWIGKWNKPKTVQLTSRFITWTCIYFFFFIFNLVDEKWNLIINWNIVWGGEKKIIQATIRRLTNCFERFAFAQIWVCDRALLQLNSCVRNNCPSFLFLCIISLCAIDSIQPKTK